MKTVLPFLFFLFSVTLFNSQNKPQQALQYFSENFPQEKIHLMLNKKSFIAGENIYFKTYIFEGFNPSEISTTLFVEILDKDKKIIEKLMLPIFHGEASGNIKLSENLTEEVYFFRAYTTWMSNFNEKFEWLMPFVIYNQKSSKKITVNTNPDLQVTLHPESGMLLNNVSNKVAVRMHANGEVSKKWKGFVFDEKYPAKKIVEFEAFDENIAQFSFTPEFGKNYKVNVEESGINKIYDMPVVKNSGISLKVKSQKGEIDYTLTAILDESSSKKFSIYGQMNNRLVYLAKINDPKSENIYKIPTAKLVNGILQLTVFDENDQIVAERLCFVEPQNLKYQKPILQNVNIDLGARKLNTFSLMSPNNFVNYAVEVDDSLFGSNEDEYSLPSTLWLTGDIASGISRPAQYFNTESNPDALDALLISEKWERFDWKNILTGNYPNIFYKPTSYISYKGEVTVNNMPAKNKTLDITFNSINNHLQVFQVRTDDNGSFILDNMSFDEPFDIFYQLSDKKEAGKNLLKVIFNPLLRSVTYKGTLPQTKYIVSSENIVRNNTSELERLSEESTFNNVYNKKEVEIKEVTITVAKEILTQKLNEELSTENFRAINETVFDFVNDDNKLYGNILDWLQGRISGLQINRDGLSLTPKLHGKEVEIYVDEFLMPAESLGSINASEVAMIKVLRPPFFGTSGNGAIAVYLKNGRSGSKSKSSENQKSTLTSKNLEGYSKTEKYANIDYAIIPSESILSDKRITLYWNSDLVSKKEESGKVNFYNNDFAKDLNVTISGYDSENKQYIYYHGFLKDLLQ